MYKTRYGHLTWNIAMSTNMEHDFGKQCLLTLFMDIMLLQILGAIGFIECSIEVW